MKTAFFIVCFVSMCQVMAQLPQLKVNVGHTRDVRSVAYSPDGMYLATASDDQMVKLWDVATGKEIKTFTGHTYNIRSIDFSQNKDMIVSSTELFGEIKLWDVATGKELKSLKKSCGVGSVSFSHDGKYFVSGNDNFTISIWETATGTEVKIFSGHDNLVNSAKFSGNDQFIVSGASDKTIILWEVATGNKIKTFSDNSGSISAVGFSPNGQQIVSGSQDNMVKVWDVASGNELKRFYGHYNWIRSVCFSPDGKKILSASWDKTIKLWDVGTGEEIKSYNEHSALVHSACFSPDGKFIASCSADKTIKIWDTNTGAVLKTMVGNFNYPISAMFSPDGKSIVSGGIDNTLKIWDLMSGKGIKIIDAHDDYIMSVCYSPDGKTIASGSNDQKIHCWDASSGILLKTLSGHNGWVASVKFSPDGRKLLSSSYDKTIKLWDVATGSELRTFTGHTCDINSAQFSPDGNYIVSGSSLFESAIKLWDVNSGNLIKTFPHAGINVSSVCFSPDGKTIASGVWDTYIKLWDIASGNEIKRFSGYNGNMVCVHFSPDGKSLVSGGYDNIVRVWDIASGKELKSLLGHTSIIRSVSYSKDGKYILSCSSDCSIRIWDAKSYNNLLSLYSVESKEWVAVSPDGRFDGTEIGIKFLYYVKGTEVIPLESSFEQFYTPGLIAQVMSGADETKPVAEFSQMLLPPEVKILSPENNFSSTSGEIAVSIQANDKGGGIDEIRLYHNDKLVDGTQRGFKMAGQNKTFTIFLTDGENRIKATAFSSQRIESIPQEIMVNYQASRQVKPNMYVLAIGINNYLNPKYCLNYAKNDAEAFAQSIKKGADPIFKKVDVSFISDADATRIGIMAAIEKIKTNAKAEDVFVFYYAGHGVMSAGSEAEKSLFYLVPSDVTKMYEADEMLKKLGISANEIGEFSKTIKAQKQLFVIDACQSGGAMQTLAMRGASEEKAIAQLARSTGTYFIAASGTEQFATEVAELGHGVFTYAVIEALKGSCKSQDGKVTVNLLKSCVEDLVPELSKKHKGQPQFPTGYGFGMDFPIVIVKE